MSKEELIEVMNHLDFHVDDIAYIDGKEFVGKKCNNSERMEWFTVEQEGSGFTRLFKGSIKEVVKRELKNK